MKKVLARPRRQPEPGHGLVDPQRAHARSQKIKGPGDAGKERGIDPKAGIVIAHHRAFLEGRAEIEVVVGSVRGGMLPKDPDRSQAEFFLPAFSSAMDRMDSALFRSSR